MEFPNEEFIIVNNLLTYLKIVEQNLNIQVILFFNNGNESAFKISGCFIVQITQKPWDLDLNSIAFFQLQCRIYKNTSKKCWRILITAWTLIGCNNIVVNGTFQNTIVETSRSIECIDPFDWNCKYRTVKMIAKIVFNVFPERLNSK